MQRAPSYGDPHDERLRLAAFAWLEEQTTLHGEVLPWASLIRGFELDGQRIPLVSMQGIFKPAALARWPLTLRTSAEGPYDDHFTRDDLLLYAYRGTDPREPDNVRLRDAMRLHVPLITARVAPISISRSAGSAPGEASPAGLEASATRAFAPRPEGDR